ncbi:MAG TPA: twin-arginine translocation signal domain-containing protein [Xanthobacteraceae bacterium]|nr:twin-arginine translocation signal domain-containing protein [Xanthobacteraceae bacterium]
MPAIGSSRRGFIKTMGAVAAAVTCGRAEAAKAEDYKPQDQKKLTQAAARYQDHPQRDESCGSCPYFIFPKSCVVVEGEISATGWCPMYTIFSPLDRGAHA